MFSPYRNSRQIRNSLATHTQRPMASNDYQFLSGIFEAKDQLKDVASAIAQVHR